MKILIADDESLVRSTLVSMLEELDFSALTIYEARTGKDVVNITKELEPDVAFIDIKMPKLNGLEAISMCQKDSTYTKWVILTGYSDFEYAQEALRLGACEYLLKPIDPVRLDRIIHKVSMEISLHASHLNKEFEREMMAINHDRISSWKTDLTDTFFKKARFFPLIFIIDSFLSHEVKEERYKVLIDLLHKYIGSQMNTKTRLAVFPLQHDHLVTIAGTIEDGNESIQSYLYNVEEIIRENSGSAFSITILQGDYCSNLQNLCQQMNELSLLSPLRSVIGINRKWKLKELTSYSRHLLNVGEILVRLSGSYRKKDYISFMKNAEEFKHAILSSSLAKNRNYQNEISLFIYSAIRYQLDIHESPEIWTENLYKQGDHLLTPKTLNHQMNTDTISLVISYIDENFMKNIGINTIAEDLHLTPNYLSTLFRKKTGTTFMRYLTKIRMLKAKELLADPKIKIKDVSEKVGYHSTRHFTKLFTEFVGVYPSDYRNHS